jgi:hypothetical protein
MNTQVSDFIDVEAKVRALGYAMPTGVTVLPYNFDSADSTSDLCYVGTHLDLRETLRDSGIPGTSLEESEGAAVQVLLRESALPEWIPLTIFVAVSFLSQNPALIDLLLGVVSNFLYDLLRSTLGRKPTESDEVTFSIVIESLRDDTYKRVAFEGSWKNRELEGLKEFAKVVRDFGKAVRKM